MATQTISEMKARNLALVPQRTRISGRACLTTPKACNLGRV